MKPCFSNVRQYSRAIFPWLFAALMLASLIPSTPLIAKERDDVAMQSRYPVDGSTFDSPFVAVAERLKPAVVYIEVVRETEIPRLPFFDFHPFFGPTPEQEDQEPRTRKVPSSGTGVIIDESGLLLTNNHVVDSATSIKVKLADGSERDGEVLGTDPETDLALLNIGKVPADHVAPLGGGRTSPVFQDFIQTDASINFGNSGGPLTNIHGEVIGINAAINTQAQNIGFAIPINLAKEVVKQLQESGKVSRGYLGMVPRELTSLMTEALNLDDDVEGVFVESVQSGTPADDGGLAASDVIIEIDGKPVSEVSDFRFRVARHAPSEKMELTVLREGKKHKLKFTLGDRTEYMADAGGGSNQSRTPDTWMGLTVVNLDSPIAQRARIEVDHGVLITRIAEDSPAEGQLRPGDVIAAVDQKPVDSVSDWNSVTSKLSDTDRAVLIKYYPQGRGMTRFVALKKE